MNINFDNQTEVVITELMNNKKCSRKEASNIWFYSETRKIIQDKYSLEHISGARCYDELIMELEHNPYWLKGQFD